MKTGQVVYTKTTEDGKKLLMRYPKRTDAEMMMEYINILSKEKTFITAQGEQKTLEEEKVYLRDQLAKIKAGTAVQLLLFLDDMLVGISEVSMKNKVDSHIGGLGISLHRNARGQRLGTLLMKVVLSEAKRALPKLKILTLSVFGQNVRALSLYRKFGFIEYGRLPKGVRYRNRFDDHVLMYKNIR